ncbi:MAG: glycosyltransferase family 2 protein [Candidatus Pacebacteria bacterium]|nr:glycosyltransferase family 2 protein [Candidatus Paceibacterota bacterium]
MSSVSDIKVSVIIPAYNEAERIQPTLMRVHEYLAAKSYPYEVIIVDDGSSDATASVVTEQIVGWPNFSIVQLPKNAGKGAAVAAGMLRARGLHRLYMDADNSTDISHWDAFDTAFRDGADVVVGSRRIQGAMVALRQPVHREMLGAAFRLIVGLIAPTAVEDTQCGFKAFTAEAAVRLFSNQLTTRWAFDVEVLRRAQKEGFHIDEVAVVWNNDRRSHLRLPEMLAMAVDLARIRISM